MQKLAISGKTASRLSASIIASTTFTTLVIDGAEYMNSSWLCLILGFIISVPIILLCIKIKHACIETNRTACILFSILFAYKAAAVTRILVNSVSYSNLENVPPLLLSALMLIVCLYIILKNDSGIGNAIKTLCVPGLLLAAIIVISNLGYMNYRWLTPIISINTSELITGSIAAAGNISAAVLIHIVSNRNQLQARTVFIGTFTGFALGLLLCVYSEIMTPMQNQETINRLRSIEMILANGRTSLGVQLPITLLWFGGYITAMASCSFCSAIYIQKAFVSLNNNIAGCISVLVSFLFSNFALAESGILSKVSLCSYPVIVIILIILVIRGRRKTVEVQA